MNKIISGWIENKDVEPQYDIAKCSSCGWRGKIEKCGTEIEQDGWEMPKYLIYTCPKCEDGGCIDDYEMSKKQSKLWDEWVARNDNGSK